MQKQVRALVGVPGFQTGGMTSIIAGMYVVCTNYEDNGKSTPFQVEVICNHYGYSSIIRTRYTFLLLPRSYNTPSLFQIK